MVKHTQTNRRQQPRNRLSVFDHFVGLVIKGLRFTSAPFTLTNDSSKTFHVIQKRNGIPIYINLRG